FQPLPCTGIACIPDGHLPLNHLQHNGDHGRDDDVPSRATRLNSNCLTAEERSLVTRAKSARISSTSRDDIASFSVRPTSPDTTPNPIKLMRPLISSAMTSVLSTLELQIREPAPLELVG